MPEIRVTVPGRGVITFADGTSDDEIQHTIEKEFPPTGEDILQNVAQDPSYAQRMTRDEFLQMRQFKEDNPVSFGTKVAEAFGGIGDIVGKAFTTAPQFDKYAGPLEKANSVVANIGQGAAVGAGDFANMFLQVMEGYSNDNNSYNRYLVSNGLKNTPENKAKYDELIDKELEGFRTLQNWQQTRKELLGQASMPAAAEAISLVAQPPLPGAAALEAFGVGERIGALGARAMQGVGKGIQGVGEAASAAARIPQQLAGMVARGLTGSEEAANRVEQMVARGSTGLAAGHLGLGLTVPGLSTTATAVAGTKAVGKGLQVAGEVTQKIAENASRGASRIGTFEALANDLSASTAARTVGRLGSAVGGDIVAPYLAAATRGAAEGAAIGGVLGFITDGEDGAAGGIGSGLALGLGGGLVGRGYAQAKGLIRQGEIVGDAIRSNATLDPESRPNASALFDRFIKDGHHEAVAELVDTRNWLSGDVDFKYINDAQAKTLPEAGGTSFEGITVLPKSDVTAKPTIYINVDKVKPGTGFHEAFHGAMRTALGDTFGKRFSDLINATFTPEEKAKFAEEYVNRGGTDEGKQRLRDYLATGENMPEEMGAEYFRQFLQRRENRDLLLRGSRAADGSLIAATKSAIDFTLNRLGITNDSASTGYKGMDALVNELVKARTDINKSIAENGKPVTTVPLERMSTPKLIDWAQQQGQSDVLLKDPTNGQVVGVKTEEQVNTGREAAYQRAAEEIANVPRGVNAPTDAELAIYGKHLPSDHVAKLTFLSEAMKRGNIINGDYFPASVKQGEQSVYASRGMTNRDFVPYKIRTTKKGVVVVDFLDVTQLKARFDEIMSRPEMLKQWGGNRDAAWADVIDYSRNLAQGEGTARPSAEIFGATKRDIINKIYGFVPTKAQLDAGAIRNLSSLGTNIRAESGTGKARIGKPAYQDSKDTRAVNSMRLDRIGKLVETKQSFPFNQEGSYGLSQVNFKPAEVLPHGKVYQSDEGYKIIGREGRFSLFDKDGQRVGIYSSAEEASKRVAALEAKTSFMPTSPMTPEEFLKASVGNAEENLRLKLAKREGTGVAKNKFTQFEDKQGRPIGVGATDEFGGKPFDVWKSETEKWLSDSEIGTFRHWYNELHDNFVAIFGEKRAPTMMMAWLAAQQNVSPGGALGNVFKVEDRLAGIGTGKKGGLADEKIQGVLTQTVPEKGFGAKLTDFVDAGFLKNLRTYMNSDTRGGQPFVADVHTGRDSGHVDHQTLSRLVEKASEGDLFINGKPVEVNVTRTKTIRNGDKVSKVPTRVWIKGEGIKPFGLEIDMTASPGGTQYEGISEWGNKLTKNLNEANWKGGGWNPAEVQAVGWMRVLRQYGLPEPTVSSALAQNTSRLYAEVNYSSGSVLPRNLPEFGKLPHETQQAITKDVMEQAVPLVANTIGGSLRVRDVSIGDGVFGGQKAPSVAIELLGSAEAVDLFALSLAYASEQAATMSAVFGTGGKDSRSLRFKKADGSKFTEAEIGSLVKDAQLGGFSVHQLPNGTEALITDARSDYTPKSFTEKKAQLLFDKLTNWADTQNVALDVKAPPTKVTSYANDWSRHQEGQTYFDLLNKRGGSSRVREVAGLREKYRAILEQAFDRHAPGVRSAQDQVGQANFMPAALSAISADIARAGIKNDVSENGNLIRIHRLVVPADDRNRGLGSGAMQQLVDYADQTGKRIALSPSTDFGGSSVSRLKDFYRRFGFVENKGRDQDLSVSESMIREPRQQINFQPEAMPNGTVYRAPNGYSVVNKTGAKFRMYSPVGILIGVANSLNDAERIISRRQ